MSDSKQVAISPRAAAVVAENKARNAVARAIRGTQWGKDLGPDGAYALAEYCRANNLDPVRHVEVLGGRPYLTAEYYREQAAPLIRAGVVIPQPVDFINADARLDKLAEAGDEWAKGELTRRLRERIRLNAPEKAAAIAVKRLVVAKTGEVIEGTNWCGGGVRQRDPVGDAEPTKTAETRAERRAWRQLAEVVSEYAQQVKRAETGVEQVEDAIVSEVSALNADRPRLHGGASIGAVVTADPYGHGDAMPTDAEVAARLAVHAPTDDDDNIDELPGSLPMTGRAA
jgi:hypothetical protein